MRFETACCTIVLVVFGSLPCLLRGQAIEPYRPTPEEIVQFLYSARPHAGTPTDQPFQEPRVTLTQRGFLQYVGTPAGYHFPPPAAGGPPDPFSAARGLLLDHRQLFGLLSEAVDLVPARVDPAAQGSSVRMQQVYRGLPIIAAETKVQVNAEHGVQSVLCDFEQNTQPLDQGLVPLEPQIPATDAGRLAREAFPDEAPPDELRSSPPQLAIFAPAVLDETGPQQLVWDLEVSDATAAVVRYRVLVDAINGNIVRAWTLNPTALNRTISDKDNNQTADATVVRREVDPPSGIAQADNAYTFLGDTYNFYFTQHGRDSDDGKGGALQATVNYCDTNNPCPFGNAEASLIFGAGFVTDDIVAHEFTHRVTRNESGLIYANASGALNESLSDIWGEFVDLSNGSGNDTPAVRWYIGEDRTSTGDRCMSNPPVFGHPDRLGSTNYRAAVNNPMRANDWGGVHRNSGVNNKLCYLLTDGGTFNGFSVYGVGIGRVAQLYYEANVNLLTSGSGWTALYNALRQAAMKLNWSQADRENLCRACLAVEIASFDTGWSWYVDWSSNCFPPTGTKNCVPFAGPFTQVSKGYLTAAPGDTLYIRTGSYNEQLTFSKAPLRVRAYDGPVTIGR
jgi:bacillolysin